MSAIIVTPDQLLAFYIVNSPIIKPTTVSATPSTVQGAYIVNFATVSGTSISYYVNINQSYDINIGPNFGTSANPFNYNEMVSRINVGGAGQLWDVYNVQGYRQIITTPVFSENWAIQTDPNKRFVIQAWDSSLYGPWMMIVYGNNSNADYNPKLSFAGTVVRNGIVYNVPYNSVGSEIEVSVTYDMFINSIGQDSFLRLTPTNGIYYNIAGTTNFTNDCFLIGSTIYTENGITDKAPANYNVNVVDTVADNFMIIADDTYNHFSGCTLNVYNSTFDVSPEIGIINKFDNFSAGTISPYWSSAFSSNYSAAHYPASATSYAVSASPSTSGAPELVTSAFFDGDFSIQYGIITSQSVSAGSIGMYLSYVNGGYDFFGIDLLYDPSLSSQVRYQSIDASFTVTTPFSLSAYEQIQFKIIRQKNNISAYVDIGSGWEYLTSRTSDNNIQGPLKIYASSNTNFGFSYLNLKSMAFFPGVFSNVQNEWVPPTPYPFTVEHPNYQQNLDYLLNNKADLAPFNGINTPPNPGYNFPTYRNYETGLFGFSRANYVKT